MARTHNNRAFVMGNQTVKIYQDFDFRFELDLIKVQDTLVVDLIRFDLCAYGARIVGLYKAKSCIGLREMMN